jgi:double-stranded uracil-DNA glycosylase
MRKRCFDPVVDGHTRLLILGSLPGDKSLALAEYYGHPQNKFWELVGSVIGVGLRALAYDERLETLRRHGVGLWDVIAEAERAGSLDTAIRGARHNSLIALVATLPRLEVIAFNGGTAARLGRKALAGIEGNVRLVDLPSSSPAHAVPFESKRAAWLAQLA